MRAKHPNDSWRPSASVQALKQRAEFIQQIRQFFNQRGVLEVETPQLSRHCVSDPHLHALSTQHFEPGSTQSTELYLQSSPEYAMKRLLASGSGDIFQICKAYRNDEVGRLHNPEFTMLEWYRVGFDMQRLINEVAELVCLLLDKPKIEQFTYKQLFMEYCELDPTTCKLSELDALASDCGLSDYSMSLRAQFADVESQLQQRVIKDGLLQVIFNQQIEPRIGQELPAVVSHFPASQAALATINADGLTANRFELYFKGIELANGFEELCDADLQRTRFNNDNTERQLLGLPEIRLDERFLASLEHGLPDCAGVALGVDRLLMLALNKSNIKDVLSFNYNNA